MQFEILNYRQEFCQYKKTKGLLFIFMLLLISSCGTSLPKLKKVDAIPIWFKAEKRFSMQDEAGRAKVHPFFDLLPFSSEKDNSVNYFVTTPIESKHYYDMDLVSGRLFKRNSYCKQADIWERYEGDIDRPRFNIGIVPRLLDPLGDPQKIIIFENKNYSLKFNKDVTFSQRARVVGGVILQFCEKYPCKTRDNWLSTLVLIGVGADDPSFKNVKKLGQLKKKINWNYFKAFMENAFGRTKNGPFEAPAYRVVGEVPAKQSLKYAISKGHLFKFKEMRSLRSSCHKLYDYLWEGSKVVRKLSKPKKKIVHAKYNENQTVISRFSNQKVETKKIKKEINDFRNNKKTHSDFSDFFFHFYKKYSDRYKTCIKFVKPSSLSEDQKRHWFFAFVNGFMNLEKTEYIYRCNKRNWVENSKLATGKHIYDLKKRRNCSATSLDYAFDQVVTVNTSLKRRGRPYYSFIEYDSGVGGSHQKIQSWVYNSGKALSCFESDEKKARAKWRKENPVYVFPEDLSWRRFTVD